MRVVGVSTNKITPLSEFATANLALVWTPTLLYPRSCERARKRDELARDARGRLATY